MSFFDRFKIRTREGRDGQTRSTGRLDELSAQVKERPGDWALENELADALAQYGRLDEAVTRLCAIGDRLAADGFIAKAHGVYKKALRLRPGDEYATRRVTELSAERINQTGMRIVTAFEEPRANEAAADTAMTETPALESVNVEVAPPIVDAAPHSPFVFEPTSYQEPAETGPRDEQPVAAFPAVAPGPPPESCAVAAGAADCIEHMIADAELAALNGDIPAAVTALRECARSHPDLIEPVAKLAEVAATHGLDDTLADAEARLCDLYCRRGDYTAARTVAEALVMRHPGETRHRARLMFVQNELAEQSATSPEPASGEIAAAEMDPDEAEDMAFRRALDVLLTCDDGFVDDAALIDARAALERAADVPRHRVAACRQLARLDADAGRWMSALAWLENAAVGIELPADEEDLAYEMALVLERAGERDRALGVFTEIATKTGPHYRDISARIVQLSSSDVSRDEHLLAS